MPAPPSWYKALYKAQSALACVALWLSAATALAEERAKAHAGGKVAPREVRVAPRAVRVAPRAVRVAPRAVSGVERRGQETDDAARTLGNWLLFLPRNVVDYTFRGTELAASLVADNQLVPRYREILGQPGVDYFVFPTLFVETGTASSVGLRMIFDSPRVAASQRFGYGGPAQVEVESRLVLKGSVRNVPYLLSLEAYYKLQDKLEYHGIGIVPRGDGRNQFEPAASSSFGLYVERRVRATVSLGLRIARDLELLLSSGIYRRQTRTMESKEDQAIDRVFASHTVTGLSNHNPFTSYSEAALRFDTREVRTRPSPGLLFEGYLGGARSVSGTMVAFMRAGARVLGFIPIYRRSNLLSPRLVLDRVVPLAGLAVPFTELARQPDFRGYDTRRDFVSIVGSLDYTWQLVPALGMRVFVDAATVAASLANIRLEQFRHMRFAGGLGVDLFAGKSTLASLALSGSGDGVRVVASIGVPRSYGDRQHRD